MIKELLTQEAYYWSPGVIARGGSRTYTSRVKIDCHWVEQNVETLGLDGEEYVTSATVATDYPVEQRGILFLITNVPPKAGNPAPSTPPEKNIIQSVGKHPDTDATEMLYKAML